MEVFLEKNGVRYINDSKATNPHAINAAVGTFADGRNIILVLGRTRQGHGFHRTGKEPASYPAGIPDRAMQGKDSRGNRPQGQMQDVQQSGIGGQGRLFNCGGGKLCDAFPATASMDMFKNYAERGNRFKEIVTELLAPKEQ